MSTVSYLPIILISFLAQSSKLKLARRSLTSPYITLLNITPLLNWRRKSCWIILNPMFPFSVSCGANTTLFDPSCLARLPSRTPFSFSTHTPATLSSSRREKLPINSQSQGSALPPSMWTGLILAIASFNSAINFMDEDRAKAFRECTSPDPSTHSRRKLLICKWVVAE